MTLIHIYDAETGKFKRSQEPAIDPLETEIQGETVYAVYPNSTSEPLPEYGKHEAPFFIEGEWVVKGQYKNVDVWNTVDKVFETCHTDELSANQVFIDDEAGIKRYKENYMMYIVNENYEIVNNPLYPDYVELKELEAEFDQTDVTYQTVLDTPVQFPLTGKMYKPRWTEDGTYANLIVAKLAGLGTFPIDIWDATKLEENKVSMDEQTFGALCAFLVAIQRAAFDTRKEAQALLIPQIEEKKHILGIE